MPTPVKHGESCSPNQKLTTEYAAWNGLRNRCNNPRDKNYRRYGGRGIRVCERWSDFRAFLADMGRRPSADHQIDRIDNNGPYSPENCRWATRQQNQRNRACNRLLTYNGLTLCLAEWAERIGTTAEALAARLRKGHALSVALRTGTQVRGDVLDPANDGRMAAPTREAVLGSLAVGDATAVDIRSRTGLSAHAVRAALTRLRREGLVKPLGGWKWGRCG